MMKYEIKILTLNHVKGFFIILTCVFASFDVYSNDSPIHSTTQNDSLPAVFMIGQFTDPFEALNNNSKTLLEICQNDVYLAYDKWLHMLTELEAISETLGLSMKGGKYWFSVFWNQDGTIKHFAFFPKQGSKEIDHSKLKEVITAFIADYKLPISKTTSNYYNYGSAAFPLPDRRPTVKK